MISKRNSRKTVGEESASPVGASGSTANFNVSNTAHPTVFCATKVKLVKLWVYFHHFLPQNKINCIIEIRQLFYHQVCPKLLRDRLTDLNATLIVYL